MDSPIILASKSPRRKEILLDMGLEIEVLHSNVDEIRDPGDLTLEEGIISIARKKAKAVSLRTHKKSSRDIVIAADTVVCLGEEILGKPKNRKQAFDMLNMLSGKKHSVITATVIIDNNRKACLEATSKTDVIFKKLNEEIINDYLDQNVFLDKAGAYGIQNNGDRLIKHIQGDFFNVMGLSVMKILTYFNTHYNMNISTDKLVRKHEYLIRKLRSDGDNNE